MVINTDGGGNVAAAATTTAAAADNDDDDDDDDDFVSKPTFTIRNLYCFVMTVAYYRLCNRHESSYVHSRQCSCRRDI